MNKIKNDAEEKVTKIKNTAKGKIKEAEESNKQMIAKKDAIILKMEQEAKEKDAIIHSLTSKIDQESAEAVGNYQSAYQGLGFNSLSIFYDEKQDAGFPARLKKDLSWFPDPVSIKSGTQAGKSFIKVQMKDKETTTAAYLGLKVKYPEIEMKIRINTRTK